MEKKLQRAKPAISRSSVNAGDSSVSIERLFHGTKKHIINAICQQGFDWRLSGTSTGTLYGKGSYFAKKASYSATYSADCKSMFLVQVLVGAHTKGNSTMVRPPPRNDAGMDPLLNLYDSCVDEVHDPTIFVVFDRDQAYPEYLIEY